VSQSDWKVRHTPKLVTCLREGYTPKIFLADLGAGLTVAVIALPLAMALGIASIPQSVAEQLAAFHPWLTPPGDGAVHRRHRRIRSSPPSAGRAFRSAARPRRSCRWSSASAPARLRRSGPGDLHGGRDPDPAGRFRFGGVIKFVPYPVTAGFTAGIGTVILASQIKDFFGSRSSRRRQARPDPRRFPRQAPALLGLRDHGQLASLGFALGSLDPLGAAPGRAARARCASSRSA
jgi:SulP family sulfate permease